MSDAVIRLDTSKPFSELHGERLPDDPHYRVHFMQSYRFNNKIVLLPFDAHGILVEDDGRRDPTSGINAEGNPVRHDPLYSDDMRTLVKKLKANAERSAKDEAVEIAGEPVIATSSADDADDGVNFVSWLRGEAKYTPQQLRTAAKKRFSKNYREIKELVQDLVLDEQLLPESAVCPALAVHLPAKAA